MFDFLVEGMIGWIDVGGYLWQFFVVGLYCFWWDVVVLGVEVEDYWCFGCFIKELDVVCVVVVD